MKALAFLIPLTGLLMLGCKKEGTVPKSTNAPTAGGNALSAPADYGRELVKGRNLALKTVDTAGLNQAVQLFYAQEGSFPKKLEELVSPNYLSKLPAPPSGMKFDYNPQTGQVKVVPQ